MLHGQVSPSFADVKDELKKNLERRGEQGAACTIYHKGKKVVYLWGGYRDVKSRAPWDRNTLITVFSTTKGLFAMTLAVAHSQGWIDYDEKVFRSA